MKFNTWETANNYYQSLTPNFYKPVTKFGGVEGGVFRYPSRKVGYIVNDIESHHATPYEAYLSCLKNGVSVPLKVRFAVDQIFLNHHSFYGKLDLYQELFGMRREDFARQSRKDVVEDFQGYVCFQNLLSFLSSFKKIPVKTHASNYLQLKRIRGLSSSTLAGTYKPYTGN